MNLIKTEKMLLLLMFRVNKEDFDIKAFVFSDISLAFTARVEKDIRSVCPTVLLSSYVFISCWAEKA